MTVTQSKIIFFYFYKNKFERNNRKMSTVGTLFKVTTFGESHGVGVGCIVDGVPPGLHLTESDIQVQMDRRRPGQSVLSTTRQETDEVKMLSGVENGITLGTPIALMVHNKDQKTKDYAEMIQHPRPGHADYTYHAKYGVSASSGGGRASARETSARVAAGGIAEKWLKETYSTCVVSWVSRVYDISIPLDITKSLEITPPTREAVDRNGTLVVDPDGNFHDHEGNIFSRVDGTPVDPSGYPHTTVAPAWLRAYTRCPHTPTAARMAACISNIRDKGDSVGGVITTVASSVPIGLGEPCFEKTEALLAQAMMSLPASKGFEIGEGFSVSEYTGTTHNDLYTGVVTTNDKTLLLCDTNHAGGTLGGITTGQRLVFRIAFKAVSSVSLPQTSCLMDGTPAVLAVKGRHDPCILPRCPPLTECMTAIVLMDLALRQRARVGVCALQTIPVDMLAKN
eukprot:GHVR01120212.1.p1 GENE.GHVR01120212.1~~GHVR01120212.1.p1  ORF type:complete len:453 (-),score=121.20 GHVR01120212.1:54-1412(-)